MPYRFPPAGAAVKMRTTRCSRDWLRSYFRPYAPFFFRSGTQALAAGLSALRRLRPGRANVLIPGYTCPSLVSAARFAGCRAIPVDIEPERPRLDPAALERHLDGDTLAVVAVDLFGIPECHRRIGELAHAAGAFFIEDAAQRVSPPVYREDVDMVVLSFGRGKPTSVLEGGALLLRSQELAGPVGALVERLGEPAGSGLKRSLRVALYNLLRHPAAYWLPAGLPLLGLGKTEYRRLESIEPMSPATLAWLPANLAGTSPGRSDGQRLLAAAVPHWSPSVTDVAEACGAAGQPLSRMPLLASSGSLKGRLVRQLVRFGASPMYPAAVAQIPGAFPGDGRALVRRLPNAVDLAQRLFTLPVHEWMDAAAVTAVDQAVCLQLAPRGAEVAE